MTIRFGTEGWRAIIAQEFTFDNVALVTQAIAEHFLAAGTTTTPTTLAVGFDARFLSERFAATVCEVFAGNGIRAVLSDRPVPTCAVSRYVVDKRLAGGVVITASHNPPSYNGIKVKEAFGGSATTETVASIERRLGSSAITRQPIEQARRQGLIRDANLMPAYVKGLRSYVDLAAIRKSRFKVLVDAMHGVGDRIAEGLVAGGCCRIETLHGQPDPLFGGHAPEPIPQHLTELARELRRRRWDIGLATDGDADRIGAVAPNGVFLNPGTILCVLLEHLMRTRKWRGAVVKTVSNTSMIERMAKALGLRLLEVPVGFKHVAKLMLEDNVLIGGEESGGIGLRGYLPERDGILMGLLVLEAMAVQGEGILEILKSLEQRYGAWRYARRDLTVQPDQVAKFFARLTTSPPTQIAGTPVTDIKTLDGVKLIGKDDSWLLFRRSGTEPIVRVYAESLALSRVKRLLDFGVQLIQSS
ncbi:MAG: phosphoglucomutase/phosphomannomutase family protein [Candidatus Omnitrophica bacterium]|nr:phosphoglucomutase/phosphomannomutase family protein [Candidatus Omnitrophota bacterium]